MGVIEARRRILLSAPHVEATTPAGVANFTTDLIAPLKSCKMGFEPVQAGSGDPSPSNIRPISGWSGLTVYKAGANLFNEQWEQGNIQTGQDSPSTTALRTGYIEVLPSTTYYGYTTRTSNVFVFEYDKNGTYLDKVNNLYVSKTFTTSANTRKIRIVDRNSGTESVNTGINYPATVTTYSPYTGTTIPVTFPAAGKNKCPTANGSGMLEWPLVTSTYRGITISGLTPGADVTLSFNVTQSTESGSNKRFYLEGESFGFADTGTAGSKSITEKASASGSVILSHNKNGIDAVYEYITDIQLELGSTATSYEPYRNAYYGGYVDLVRGVVVAEYLEYTAKVSDGVKTEYEGINQYDFKNICGAQIVNNNTQKCSIAKYAYVGSTNLSDHFYVYYSNDTSIKGRLMLFLLTPADETQEFTVVFPLTTPITYPLTPQVIKSLRGVNNIWSDANGDVSVEYWKH